MDRLKLFSASEDDILTDLGTLLDKAQPVLPHVGMSGVEFLSISDNEEIRSTLAAALVNDAPSDLVSVVLRRLCEDDNEIVRINAVDTLGSFPSAENAECLLERLADEDELVRSYAMMSLTDMQPFGPDYLPDLLVEQADKEGDYGRTTAYECLCRLGREAYLEPLIGMFDSDDYYVQVSVLRALRNLLKPENAQRIRTFANTVSADKLCTAVRDSFDSMMQHLVALPVSHT